MRRIAYPVVLAVMGAACAHAQDAGTSANTAAQPPAHGLTLADAIPGKDHVKRAVVLRGLDKITGRPANVFAPVGIPVRYATLTITARYCYSTPPSETPETTAFLQIDDHRPDQAERRVFSGWMYASSPGLNGMQHPLYDVWVIRCNTNAPGQAPSVTAETPVKPVSPNEGANEAMPDLPEGAGQ